MTITIPDLSLIVLVGPSGSGKSTFAARHFLPTEVVSSDDCRGLVGDDPNDQSVTEAAFEVLHTIVAQRLTLRRLAVVDATNVQPADRRALIQVARDHHVLPIALVLDVPERICQARNAGRPDRDFGPHVVRNQHRAMRRSIPALRREGFHRVVVLHGPDDIDGATLARTPLWTDRRDEHGPFDIIGDIHGCHQELVALLGQLGYEVEPDGSGATHPDGRRVFFVGDLVDRGPASPAVLRLAMGMVAAGTALCIPGNHEAKLLRALRGARVTTGHGLAETLQQLAAEPPELTEEVTRFLDGLVSHAVVDDGRLVVAHAGLREDMQGRSSAAVRSFALYGDTTGETDEFGLPVRYPWAEDYRGQAAVVYGHTPVPDATWVNNTICIDTGCVFGGRLTALRWPERELVSVPAERMWWEPTRPLVPADPAADLAAEDLDLADVTGKRTITTGLQARVTIREENSVAALEVMSRFAADPRWLVYLPPTMAPVETSRRSGTLEHPEDVFAAFRADGVERVVCEEKHMGSRAVIVVCRDEAAAERRFGADEGEVGRIVTRTGREFFPDRTTEAAVLDRLRRAAGAAGLWEELGTDWLVLDTELLPWSAKAEELLRRQYAAVGAGATATAAAEAAVLRAATGRGAGDDEVLARAEERVGRVAGFVAAYRRYCWPVAGVDDLQIAPFQILAGEGRVHARTDHRWHLEVLGRLVSADTGLLRPTASTVVELGDVAAEAAATEWWEEMTASGGEGMVVKPVDVIATTEKGLVQPGIKCRGREYLRIIYGPEYDAPDQIDRLRPRRLGHKRALALREFALGIEALERFVADEPLRRVHECVFGVLALESEPVDPRL